MEVLQRTANRGSVSTGYDIDNSLKLEADNSESLTRSAQDGGDRKKVTISFWTKRTELTGSYEMLIMAGVNGNKYSSLGFQTTNTLDFHYYNSGSYPYQLTTNRVFRDASAWYHIVIAVDTTQGTAANRLKMYINGVQETSFAYETYPDQNIDTPFNNDSATYPIEIGNDSVFDIGGIAYSGYIAEFNLIDGSQLAPTEFGEFDDDSGIWIPKAYTGSYGDNGFYLDFADSGDLGDDESGNGNDFTEVNIAAADQATDTPTNNFCTFNPLMTQNNPPTISEGAMKSTGGGGTWNNTWGNMGVKNGKWYYEMKATNTSYTGYFGASTAPAEGSNTTGASISYNTSFFVGEANSIDYYYWQNGSLTANESTGWGGFSNNDVLALALDLDSSTKKFYLYKNGSLLNSGGTNLPTNMQDEFVFPLYIQYENRQDELNFGGYTISSISSAASDANGYGTFEYAPPTGYYALCTKNLAEFG